MKKVWYRKQSSHFKDINASPDRPVFFSDDFDYMTLFGEDIQQPKVFVVFLDKNTPMFDVWSDSVSKLCGYPPAAERFLLADALETVTSFLGYFLKLVGDRRDVESVRSALKTLNDECMPTEDIISESSDKELLDFTEWAAKLLDRSSAAGIDPYRIVIDDMLKAKPGAKGIIDGPGSLMSVDPDIQSSVAYELSMSEVQWLSDHRMNDMQSNNPTRVQTAIDACRCHYGMPAQLKEDKKPLPVTDLGCVLRLDACRKQKDMCWDYDGFVLAHKDINPNFDKSKPFMIVINQDGNQQMHFENFGTMPKNEKILDDMYTAIAKSCEKGMELICLGGATPGGISGMNKLCEYGFKKVSMPADTNVYWGGEMNYDKLDKWLNNGRHNDDFLVKDGNKYIHPDNYSGKISYDNTKPRPFKLVKENKIMNESERQIHYWAHMLDEAMNLK